MFTSDRFYVLALIFNYWIFISHVLGLCEDECRSIDKYTLVCDKVIQNDLQDCHEKFSEVSTLRLNWYGLNYSFVDQRDFYTFSSLTNVLIEPSNTPGFLSRSINAEEYENPKLWTTYEAVVLYGRVLHVRLFSDFFKESCCSKWMSRIVLANLLSPEITIPWFKRCFAGFNLFCQNGVEKPPISTIMAWIESIDEFKEILEKYCTVKDRTLSRFKRSIEGAVKGERKEKEAKSSGEQAVKTIYKYEKDQKQGENDVSFEDKRAGVLNKPANYYYDYRDDSDTLEFFKRATIVLFLVCLILAVVLSAVCCLYCRAVGAIKNLNCFNNNPVSNRRQDMLNATFDERDSDGWMPASDRRPHFLQPPPRQYQPNPSNNNNYLTHKQYSKHHRKDVNNKGDDNKFVSGLRSVFGLRKSGPSDQSEEREKLISHGAANDQNNNNMTNNINSSNCDGDKRAIDEGLRSGTNKADDENIGLSDEEELEQVFLDHLYNRMRSHARFDYLNQFDKYGYLRNNQDND